MLGLNYYNAGDFNKSASIFSALPSVYDVLINLGMAKAGNNDFSGAMAAWKQALGSQSSGHRKRYFNMAYLA